MADRKRKCFLPNGLTPLLQAKLLVWNQEMNPFAERRVLWADGAVMKVGDQVSTGQLLFNLPFIHRPAVIC